MNFPVFSRGKQLSNERTGEIRAREPHGFYGKATVCRWNVHSEIARRCVVITNLTLFQHRSLHGKIAFTCFARGGQADNGVFAMAKAQISGSTVAILFLLYPVLAREKNSEKSRVELRVYIAASDTSEEYLKM